MTSGVCAAARVTQQMDETASETTTKPRARLDIAGNRQLGTISKTSFADLAISPEMAGCFRITRVFKIHRDTKPTTSRHNVTAVTAVSDNKACFKRTYAQASGTAGSIYSGR